MVEYVMDNLWQVWAIIAIICLILELTGGDFFMVCFSIGAVSSSLSVFIGVPPLWQLLVFAVFSILSLFFVRPWAKRYLVRSSEGRLSNADAIIGRIGQVSETIGQSGYGRVAVDGDDWKARSKDGNRINAGERVKIIHRDCIIVTVERVENSN